MAVLAVRAVVCCPVTVFGVDRNVQRAGREVRYQAEPSEWKWSVRCITITRMWLELGGGGLPWSGGCPISRPDSRTLLGVGVCDLEMLSAGNSVPTRSVIVHAQGMP
jgi:hypothetical protein